MLDIGADAATAVPLVRQEAPWWSDSSGMRRVKHASERTVTGQCAVRRRREKSGVVPDPAELVLVALAVKGFAPEDQVRDLTALPGPVTASVLEQLSEAGLAVKRAGRMPGWSISADGKAEAARRLSDARADGAWVTQVQHCYEAFIALNDTFKQLCTDWQLRDVHGTMIPNAHDDPAYDNAIGERLEQVHRALRPVLDGLAGAIDRFGVYWPRLAAAIERFRNGDGSALARPASGSYHDVWMEIHQDLLLTLGIERSGHDGA